MATNRAGRKEESEARKEARIKRVEQLLSEFPQLPKPELKIARLLTIDGVLVLIGYILYVQLRGPHPGIALIALSVATSLLSAGLFNFFAKWLDRRELGHQLEVGRAILAGVENRVQPKLDGLGEQVEQGAAETKRLIDLATGAKQVGLVQVFDKDSDKGCVSVRKEIVRSSRHLVFFGNMWDCHWFEEDHKQDLRDRLREDGKSTTLIMLDPESVSFATLAQRLCRSSDKAIWDAKILEMKRAQDEFIRSIVSINGSGQISSRERHRVLGMRYYQPYFLLLGDELVIIGYPFAAYGSRRSAFLYRYKPDDSGLYVELKKDVEAICESTSNVDLRSSIDSSLLATGRE